MIRVVVCDDHAVVRAGLGQLIGTFDGVRGRRDGRLGARRRSPLVGAAAGRTWC